MDDVITRAEHEEFKKRIEDENHRQNKRIEVLEKITQQINSAYSVSRKARTEYRTYGKRAEAARETLGNIRKSRWRYVENSCKIRSYNCPRSCSWCSGNEIWIEIKETNYEH